MKKVLLLLLQMCLVSTFAYAQGRLVSGKVLSGSDNQPIPGVSVVVKGTNTGVVTDVNGGFNIRVPDGASTLVFAYVGFKAREVDISGGQTSLDISLEEDVRSLEEVIVVGYSTIQKRELTGAVSSVKGDVIENLPMQSFDRALQGRAAGVQILSANGVPGGAVNVRIRGTGSISAGNDPLFIVDGVQLNTRNDGGANISANPLNFLNPNDIESIEVLKDAANASIYGAQAANGVVIITTKKGKAGPKTRFDFNYYRGVVEPVPLIDVMNTQQFLEVRQEAVRNSNPSLTPQQIRQQTFPPLGLDPNLTDEQIAALPTYNWQQAAYQNGIINNYELSMSGGSDQTTFYGSVAYNQQTASLININFERLGGRINLNHKINKKLAFDLGINLSTVKQTGPYGDARTSTAFGAPQYSAPIIVPLNPIYNENGTFFGLPGNNQVMVGDIQQNVIANSSLIKSLGRTNQAVGNLALTYKIMDGLVFKAFGGMDYRHLYTDFFGDPRLPDYFNIQGTNSVGNSANVNLTTNYTLAYNKTLAQRHNFSALGGFEYRTEVQEGTSLTGRSFPTPDFQTANAAAIPFAVGGFWTGFKRAGIFGNFKYDYDKRYLFNFTMRYDGSSRFGANSRYGFFPSVSGAWNISEEAFLKNNSIVSDLRLRASWGTTGNDQIANFASRGLYGLGGVYGGVQGISPSQMGNPDLVWERNETTNLGLDYGFFNNRIKGSFEAFRRISRDLLLTQSIPQTAGFNSITKNVGEVLNEGLEFELTTTNVERGGFKWETNFNITLIRNEVLSLFDGLEVLPGNLSIRVGYPLGTNIAVPYAGVNPANGRPMWYDINDNITYLVVAADQRPMGHDNQSKAFGGFTNTFSYKGFELSTFFNYDYGRVLANFQNFRLADVGAVPRNGAMYYYENRWTTPGQITDVPAAANNRTLIAGRVSSYQTTARFYEDASFIRLKQLTLAYNLPRQWVEKAKLSRARIYAQGINLLTWTKWTGFDPEFAPSGGLTGTEGIIPQSKNYTVGVQIGF